MARQDAAPAKATRRARGAPRLLLLDAARTLFARQDYRSTTTREIADTAGVLEHLLFRQFGSKAALFNEAVVVAVPPARGRPQPPLGIVRDRDPRARKRSPASSSVRSTTCSSTTAGWS